MKINHLLSVFLVLFSVSVFASISTKERQALVDLNKSTNGENWNTKWDLNQPVESWYGVIIKENKVVGLDLAANNLEGSINTSILDLKFLETLNMFKNKLSGEIPAELFNLTNLISLNLSFNSFTGQLPNTIGNAKSLVSLEIFMNRLSGQIPESIGNLKNLEMLSLFNNALEGELPQGLFQLDNLKELLLNSNYLSGDLDAKIANLTKLENLSLFDNKLKGTIPSLEKLNKLVALNLSLNNFTNFTDDALVNIDKFKLEMYKNNSKEKIRLADKKTNLIATNKNIQGNPVTLTIKE